MELETAIRDIVRTEIAALVHELDIEPEMITPEQAAELFGCGKQVILDLHHERDTNGFPSVQLGRRTICVDKRRLQVWVRAGGLMNVKE